jgi:hypothetical protein
VQYSGWLKCVHSFLELNPCVISNVTLLIGGWAQAIDIRLGHFAMHYSNGHSWLAKALLSYRTL